MVVFSVEDEWAVEMATETTAWSSLCEHENHSPAEMI